MFQMFYPGPSSGPNRVRFRALLVVFAFSLLMLSCGDSGSGVENWPAYTPQWQALAATERSGYIAAGFNASEGIENYDSLGDYFHFETLDWRSWHFDAQGFPMAYDKVGKTYYYNPVSMAQYGLTQYAGYLHSTQDSSKFLGVANKLSSLVGSDGALRYPTVYFFNGNKLQPGWVSGLSQGQALSVFGRAYSITHDPKWIAIGNQVRSFMLIPTSEGGTRGTLQDLDPSLSHETTFEEITCHPSCTILNGFLYGTLGLYDWWKTTGDEKAHQAFIDGESAASKILHYYEIGGFSAYDMRQVILKQTPDVSEGYHERHIQLTNAYFTITGDTIFSYWSNKWQKDVTP